MANAESERSVSSQAGPPTQIIFQQSGGPWQRFAQWLGWVGLLICLALLIRQYVTQRDYFDTSQGIREKFHSGAKYASNKIAIITVAGVILEGEGFVKHQIERVRKDKHVKAIVLRVNSPGGTVAATDYLYHHLKKLREEKQLPMVVSMGGIAASGGYYVSMAVGQQEKSVYAEPTTTTGSIGVMIPHYDLSGLLERLDIKDDSMASHPRKQMLSITRPIPEDHRRLLEDYIDESFTRFKNIVKEGRPGLRSEDNKLESNGVDLATGEIFTAMRAKKHGLVDEIGFIEEAIDRALELADLNESDTRVIRYERLPSLLELPAIAKLEQGAWDLNALFDLSSPRAYYLATSLPPLVSSWPQAR